MAQIGTQRGRRLAGEQIVSRRGVVHILVRHRTYDGQLVGAASYERKVLANLDAGHRRGDRQEFAANFRGSVRFEIPGVLMRRPAPHEQENARPRPNDLPRGIGEASARALSASARPRNRCPLESPIRLKPPARSRSRRCIRRQSEQELFIDGRTAASFERCARFGWASYYRHSQRRREDGLAARRHACACLPCFASQGTSSRCKLATSTLADLTGSSPSHSLYTRSRVASGSYSGKSEPTTIRRSKVRIRNRKSSSTAQPE